MGDAAKQPYSREVSTVVLERDEDEDERRGDEENYNSILKASGEKEDRPTNGKWA